MKRYFFVLSLISFLLFLPTYGLAKIPGGTVTYAAGADPDRLDPANAESNPSEAVNRMMYENLAKFDEKLNIVPGLATKWEQSKDGMTWTFFLRKGVKFHDGAPFNSEAVKVFIERMIVTEKLSRAGLYLPFVHFVEMMLTGEQNQHSTRSLSRPPRRRAPGS